MRAERAADQCGPRSPPAGPYREVVALRFFGDLTLEEIGRETERPLNTVKTHLRRGLLRLRERSNPGATRDRAQRRFDPAELHIPGEPDPTLAEQADALATARDLESLDSGPSDRQVRGPRSWRRSLPSPPRASSSPRRGRSVAARRAFLVTVRQSGPSRWAAGGRWRSTRRRWRSSCWWCSPRVP
jgi:hypothetical protein